MTTSADQSPAHQSSIDPREGTTDVGITRSTEDLSEHFFRLNAAHITYHEIRQGAKWWNAPFSLAMLKLMGRTVPCSTDDPPVKSLKPFLCSPQELPGPLNAEVAARADELARLGFHSPSYHFIDDPLHKSKHLLVTFPHAYKPVVARIHLRLWLLKSPAVPKLFVEFVSRVPSKGFAWTIGSTFDMQTPSNCHVTRDPKASVDGLLAMHTRELAAFAGSTHAASGASQADALDIVDSLHADLVAFHTQRKVFAPLNQQELQAFRRHAQSDIGTPAEHRHPQVLEEVERLVAARSNPALTIILLFGSLALFVLIGIKGWGWTNLLILVPVLLFHELGHFLAMKVFGFRNLKMFFIPGFGAAVTGRTFGISGWKYAVVSLMGPLPGIFLGIIIGLTGAVMHSPTAVHVAVMAIAINAFNLLPLLPFDGGHVMRTVLFARHPVLDVGFRALAALALFGLLLLTKSTFMIALIVLAIMTLPSAYRLAKVAHSLKQRGFVAESADGKSVPPQVADDIAEEIIKAHPPSAKFPKNVAQGVLGVFETLNTRPPGILASTGIIGAHALSFLAAVVFAVVLVASQRGGGDFIRAAVTQPPTEYVFDPASPAPATEQGLRSPIAVLATFENPAAANSALQEAQSMLGPGEHALVFASTLVIRLPQDDLAARARWFDHLSPKTDSAFVSDEKSPVEARFQCLARNTTEAEAITKELNAYFTLPHEARLIAPWSTFHPLTSAQLAARATNARIDQLRISAYKSPEYLALSNEIARMTKRGERQKLTSLYEQSSDVIERYVLKKVRDIASSPASADSDPEFASAYADILQSIPVAKYRERAQAMASRLGPRLGIVPTDSPDTSSTASGYARNAALLIEISGLRFEDPGVGSDAMVRWLNARGCRAFRYEVYASEHWEDDEDPANSGSTEQTGTPAPSTPPNPPNPPTPSTPDPAGQP